MIRILGFQRFLILLLLLAAALGLGFANFFVFGPQALSASSQLGALQSEEAALRSEIDLMRGDQTKFQEQKSLFDNLEKKGFLGGQDRVLAREIINEMQRASKIVSVKYEIKSASMSEIEGVTDEKYGILISPIEMKLEAIDDLDVYRFIYMMTYIFPGKVSIKSLEIERPEKLTTEMLRTIGSGTPLPLIKATLNADWATIAPRGSAPVAVQVETEEAVQ